MVLIRPRDSKMRHATECLHKGHQPNRGSVNVLLAASALRQSLRFTHLISQHPGSIHTDLSVLWGYEYLENSAAVKVG